MMMRRHLVIGSLLLGVLTSGVAMAAAADMDSAPSPYAIPPTPPTPYANALDQTRQDRTITPAAADGQPPPGGWSPGGIVNGPAAGSSQDAIPRFEPATLATDRSNANGSTPGPIVLEQSHESTWCFRLDSYTWTERIGGVDAVKETGPISTVGYQRRSGQERFRLEVFGGEISYDGYTIGDNSEHYHQSHGTDIFGGRGEYDLLFEPDALPSIRFLIGVGTRLWMRNLNDAYLADSNTYVTGYQETWWTFYPYLGLETRPQDPNAFHWFAAGRVGMTAFTYQYANIFDSVYNTCGNTLYPKCGVTAQGEIGVAYRKLTLSAFTEFMAWNESNVVRGWYQPQSQYFTVGGRFSFTF